MIKRPYHILLLVLFFSSCATYNPQYKTDAFNSQIPDKEIEHTFYLIGDAGNSPLGSSSKALVAFETELSKASENSTAIFLGDNIYSKGLPKKNDETRAFAEHQLNVQTSTVKNFKGQTVFIPGNHDWYSDGVEGLKRQEKYIEDILGKNTFLPENGCPIERIHVSDDIDMIIIDTEWYLTNWDKHPTINDNCDIKTRFGFFEEYTSLIKKARGKTTIVALHHPMYTNGPHNGQFSFKESMKPAPVLGTLKNVIRKTSGISPADLQNKKYNTLKKRLITISQENKKVVFVSGHEHSLQYIVEDNLRQIVSGSGSKITATRNVGGGQFSYATLGYTRLDVFKDGSSYARFYSVEDDKVVFETIVHPPNTIKSTESYPDNFPSTKLSSIYTDEETKKSGAYKFLWGERFRETYSTKVLAPTVNLDTLYGGVVVIKKGGGNQSRSLRLEDKNGAQYVMRALKKNAIQYIQAIMFKDQYIAGQFDNTGVENLILDVYTGSHPYAPFVIGTLADAIDVYHTNPVLYYIPRQKTLRGYNGEFGDELYMIEEHTSEGHADLASFGFKDKIISTNDVMKKIHKDEDIVIDEAAYIRARLFDMLIGDWDRHQDQWRWIEFKEDGKKVYRPLPRDRDQAFSNMSDGLLLGGAATLLPPARLLRKYDVDIKNLRTLNVQPFNLDMEFIQESNKEVWDAQVKVILDGITDEVIEKAFLYFPKEVRNESVDEIKRKLKGRRANLQSISDRYYDIINNIAVVKGTNKDDYFTITCANNGDVTIVGQRIKKNEKAQVFHEKTYDHSKTKEIWIYGLDDDDVFEVIGKNKKIKIRLIGGQNKDVYNISEGGKTVIYDYKSKPNDFENVKGAKVMLTDDYETNVYDYKKLKSNTNQILPLLGSNPDDGFSIGVNNIFSTFGFEQNPFTYSHNISASYYLATDGYDLGYEGEFASVYKNLNLGVDLHFNSPNYAINFFGFGNTTPNFEANETSGIDVDLDFNRVKIRTFSAMPSIIWRGEQGAKLKFGLSYESNEVERTNGRFLDEIVDQSNALNAVPVTQSVFDKQDFYGVDAFYNFENRDNDAFPALGMKVDLQLGYKSNVSSSKSFGYIIPELGVDYKILSSGKLVFSTTFKGHFNLGDDFEFYQGATLGANNGLRGYREERFTGKSTFVQSSDIRWNIMSVKTRLIPLSLGVFGGADYGRIWVDNDLVLQNDFNTNSWNTSFGGGLFVSFAQTLNANIAAFNSDDGLRLAFKLGIGF